MVDSTETDIILPSEARRVMLVGESKTPDPALSPVARLAAESGIYVGTSGHTVLRVEPANEFFHDVYHIELKPDEMRALIDVSPHRQTAPKKRVTSGELARAIAVPERYWKHAWTEEYGALPDDVGEVFSLIHQALKRKESQETMWNDDLFRHKKSKKLYYERSSGEAKEYNTYAPGAFELAASFMVQHLTEHEYDAEFEASLYRAIGGVLRQYRLSKGHIWSEKSEEMPAFVATSLNWMRSIPEQKTRETKFARRELYGVFSQMSVAPSQQEEVLWQMDRFLGDYNDPLAFDLAVSQYGDSNTMTSWARSQESRKQDMKSLVAGSPQEVFERFEELLVLAEQVVITDPFPAGKVGMEIELDLQTRFTRRNGYREFAPVAIGWSLGTDIGVRDDGRSNREIRRNEENLVFDQAYLKTISELTLWLRDHATHVAGFHIHLDAQKHPFPLTLRNVFGGHWSDKKDELGTYEFRGLFPPIALGENPALLDPASVANIATLFAHSSGRPRYPAGIQIHLPDDYHSGVRGLLWGHMVRAGSETEYRLRSLMALKHHRALSVVEPDVIGESFTPESRRIVAGTFLHDPEQPIKSKASALYTFLNEKEIYAAVNPLFADVSDPKKVKHLLGILDALKDHKAARTLISEHLGLVHHPDPEVQSLVFQICVGQKLYPAEITDAAIAMLFRGGDPPKKLGVYLRSVSEFTSTHLEAFLVLLSHSSPQIRRGALRSLPMKGLTEAHYTRVAEMLRDTHEDISQTAKAYLRNLNAGRKRYLKDRVMEIVRSTRGVVRDNAILALHNMDITKREMNLLLRLALDRKNPSEGARDILYECQLSHRAIRKILPLLESRNVNNQAFARSVLYNQQSLSKQTARDIISLLSHHSTRVRLNAAYALGNLWRQTHDISLVVRASKTLFDTDPDTDKKILSFLERCPELPEWLVNRVVSGLYSADEDIRSRAFYTIFSQSRLQFETMRRLGVALYGNFETSRAALHTLESVKEITSCPTTLLDGVFSSLHHSGPDQRKLAAIVVAKLLGTKRITSDIQLYVISRLADTTNRYWKDAAGALNNYQVLTPAASRAINTILEEGSKVKKMRILWQLRTRYTLPATVQGACIVLLSDRDDEIRSEAEAVLRNTHKIHPFLIPRLERLFESVPEGQKYTILRLLQKSNVRPLRITDGVLANAFSPTGDEDSIHWSVEHIRRLPQLSDTQYGMLLTHLQSRDKIEQFRAILMLEKKERIPAPLIWQLISISRSVDKIARMKLYEVIARQKNPSESSVAFIRQGLKDPDRDIQGICTTYGAAYIHSATGEGD